MSAEREQAYVRAMGALRAAQGAYGDLLRNEGNALIAAADRIDKTPVGALPDRVSHADRVAERLGRTFEAWEEEWDRCMEAGRLLAQERKGKS